jgi:dienelactone hydrolase
MRTIGQWMGYTEPMRRVLTIALMLLLPSGFGAAAQSVSFPSVATANVAAGPPIKAWLAKPAGEGPFPAVIVLHSCAGVGPHAYAWARLIGGWGYVTLVPDSFGSRGEGAVCTRPNVVTPKMRVADVAGAAEYLATLPFVDKDRIALIGYSHGGSTVMRALQRGAELARRGVKGGVAYYPGCYPQFDRAVDARLLILIGDKDDWTPADRCRALQSAGFVRPELVEAVYYPDAYHSFDANLRSRTVPGAPGTTHHLEYDPSAAADAEARTKAFFEKLLR